MLYVKRGWARLHSGGHRPKGTDRQFQQRVSKWEEGHYGRRQPAAGAGAARKESLTNPV